MTWACVGGGYRLGQVQLDRRGSHDSQTKILAIANAIYYYIYNLNSPTIRKSVHFFYIRYRSTVYLMILKYETFVSNTHCLFFKIMCTKCKFVVVIKPVVTYSNESSQITCVMLVDLPVFPRNVMTLLSESAVTLNFNLLSVSLLFAVYRKQFLLLYAPFTHFSVPENY